MSIIGKAQALGEEIMDSSEYSEMKETEQAIYQDETAKNLLNDFQSKQQRLQMAQTNGQQVTQKQQQELQALQAKMQNNEKIKEFMEAQQQFNQVMQTVNQTISNVLSGENTEE